MGADKRFENCINMKMGTTGQTRAGYTLIHQLPGSLSLLYQRNNEKTNHQCQRMSDVFAIIDHVSSKGTGLSSLQMYVLNCRYAKKPQLVPYFWLKSDLQLESFFFK